jgi:hypothetical protein
MMIWLLKGERPYRPLTVKLALWMNLWWMLRIVKFPIWSYEKEIY